MRSSPLVCYYQKGLKLDEDLHTITANESTQRTVDLIVSTYEAAFTAEGPWLIHVKPALLNMSTTNGREIYSPKSEGEMLTRVRVEASYRVVGYRAAGNVVTLMTGFTLPALEDRQPK